MFDAKFILAFFTVAVSVIAAFAVARYQLKQLAEEVKTLIANGTKLELELVRHRADRLKDQLEIYRYSDNKFIHSAEFGQSLSGIYSRLERIENKLMDRDA